MKRERERTRNGFDLRFIAFQTGSVRVLFESCSGLVRAL
ncbi:hypothetical protein LEP1GSC036_2224 [Leptospira weilii str. 2006001853]|uniref:Uncharacterized protein n=1 Tax=Leptospira weilii str. 2006001853 TaxID=1001589 RepID=A0A828YWH9_9LEPT|nr:hypothetical protein LEP1GSC036_2224 [Leptospira weilii str. 2006001853]